MLFQILAVTATLLPLSGMLRQRTDKQPYEEAVLLATFLEAFSRHHLSSGNLVICMQTCNKSASNASSPLIASSPSLSALTGQMTLTLLHDHLELPLVVDCPGSGVEYDGVNFHNFFMLSSGGQPLLDALARVRPYQEDKRGADARLLVVILEQPDAAGSLSNIMEALWAVSWGLVVVAVHEGGAVLSLYSMAPYANSSGLCGRAGMQVAHLARVYLLEGSFARWLPSLPPLFVDPLPRDMQGCAIRAGTFTGLSDLCGQTARLKRLQLPLETRVPANILGLAAQGRNFKALWIPDDSWDSKETENGQFEGPLGNLQKGMYDVAIGSYTMTPIRMRYLQPTVPFYETSLAVWLRCPLELPWHRSILKAKMWLFSMLAISFVATVAAKVGVKRCGVKGRPRGWWFAAIAKAALDVWSVLCEVPSSNFSRVTMSSPSFPSRMAVRCVVGSWLLLVFYLNGEIKGLLTAQSTTTPTTKRLKSLEDLVNYDPPFTIMYTFEDSRAALSSLGVRNQLEKCEGESGISDCENRFRSTKSLAAVRVRGLPSAFKCTPSCLYSLRTNLKRVSFAIFTRRSFPVLLLRFVDQVILRLHSAGLIHVWAHSEWSQRRYVWNTTKPSWRTKTTSPFFWPVFQWLLLGLFLAALACAIEMVHARTASWTAVCRIGASKTEVRVQ